MSEFNIIQGRLQPCRRGGKIVRFKFMHISTRLNVQHVEAGKWLKVHKLEQTNVHLTFPFIVLQMELNIWLYYINLFK